MKEKAINEVVKNRFKTIDKLTRKIIQDFDQEDIHDIRVEIKKLRAFLRLMDEEKSIEKPLLPKLLKTFYGYIGIIRNIQLHRHSLFKYITDYSINRPVEYIKLIDAEDVYWQKEAKELMEDNGFEDAEEIIVKQLPEKLNKPSIKKFVEKKLDELKPELEQMTDDTALHTVRKILKDVYYTWNYTKDDAALPKVIAKEEDLKLLTTQLGDFRDKCIQLEFMQPEYLDKIKNEDEKAELLKLRTEYEKEKNLMKEELSHPLTELKNQL